MRKNWLLFGIALLVVVLAVGAFACSDDDDVSDEAPPTTEEQMDDVADDSDDMGDDTEESGELPGEFRRGPEEAFDLAREACGMWEEWQTDDGEDALAPIVVKADEAQEASDVRDIDVLDHVVLAQSATRA